MDSELNKILDEGFSPEINMKRINYKSMFILESYKLIADTIENFEVRDDDTWVCTFPKAGNLINILNSIIMCSFC